jgi:hypothetical protein
MANFEHSPLERFLIRLGRFMKSADLSHELQRRAVQLLFGCNFTGFSQNFDASAHRYLSTSHHPG